MKSPSSAAQRAILRPENNLKNDFGFRRRMAVILARTSPDCKHLHRHAISTGNLTNGIAIQFDSCVTYGVATLQFPVVNTGFCKSPMERWPSG